MKKEEIEKILPHRGHMLLLDEVEARDGVSCGYYTVRGDEFFLKGHFPKDPIVPGVILCEILAQSACILLKDTLSNEVRPLRRSMHCGVPGGYAIGDGQLPMYTGMDKVRFRLPVRPGDTIQTECRIKRVKHPFYFAEGTASVKGKVCMSAEFSFAITEA